MNHTLATALGHAESALVGRDWTSLASAPPGAEDTPLVDRSGQGDVRRFEASLSTEQGHPLRAEVTAITCVDPDGNHTGYHCIIRLHPAGGACSVREALEARYRALFDDNPSMMFAIEPDGTIIEANRAAAEHLGYGAADLSGARVDQLHEEVDRETVREHLLTSLEDPEGTASWQIRKRRRDGTTLWVRETVRVIRTEEGHPAILSVCQDISEAHDLSRRLAFQANHDALTGLINRDAFDRRLRRVLETVRTEDGQHALCYMDLDQFKVINDTCGHVAGDELLRQLGDLLPRCVRKRDTLARLGGDEFGLLMEHCTLGQARRVANSLRRAVSRYRFLWEDKSFTIGVSIGLVPIDASSPGVTAVLSAADSACYAAKDAGRNRIHVFRSNDRDMARRHGEMQWVSRINRALEDDRLMLQVQPIVPIGGTASRHFEVLLRMQDETGRVVPPAAFLPAAERYNLSSRLDRWVVGTTFRWLTDNSAEVDSRSMCFINVSGHSVADEEFLTYVIRQLDDIEIAPERVCFEITETAAIANLTSATRFIRALKGWGCRFALDDFGSGLSSFAYLKTLPVDFLKIDGLFVKGIVDDPTDLAMVRSINEIGQVMGKRTIAEFVENRATLDQLRIIGVDYAQGFEMGRPVPMEELVVGRIMDA